MYNLPFWCRSAQYGPMQHMCDSLRQVRIFWPSCCELQLSLSTFVHSKSDMGSLLLLSHAAG